MRRVAWCPPHRNAPIVIRLPDDREEGGLSNWSERVLIGLNTCAILGALAYFGLEEHSVVRVKIASTLERRRSAATVRARWEALAGGGTWYARAQNRDTIVVFTDYECPYCRQLHLDFERGATEAPLPNITYRQFPMPFHTRAAFAGHAAACSGKIGEFAGVHKFLMESRAWIEADSVAMASLLPVHDTLAFRNCMESSYPDSVMQADALLAQEIGVNGTPAFVTKAKGLQIGKLEEAEGLWKLEPRLPLASKPEN